MKCKNCGADYKTRDLMCPYCQTENIIGKLWKVKRTEVEREYEESRREIGKKSIAFIADRILSRCIIIGILTIVLIVCGVFIVFFAQDKIKGYTNERDKELILAKAQEYYNNGEFAIMGDYLYDLNVTGDEFYPYKQMHLLNNYYEEYINYKLEVMTMTKEELLEDEYSLSYSIRKAASVCRLNIGIYDELHEKNRPVYEEYKKDITGYLKGYLGFSDEEVFEIVGGDSYLISTDIDEYAYAARERLVKVYE